MTPAIVSVESLFCDGFYSNQVHRINQVMHTCLDSYCIYCNDIMQCIFVE